MNRTDRLYALVEQLRAVSPRRRTAKDLAQRFEVSVRTIERDISALQQAGVPIYADVGRRGGYALDRSMTLPPLNFTPEEAVAVSVALQRAGGSPYAKAARTALQKIVAAMPVNDASAARELARKIVFLERPDTSATVPIPDIIETALAERQILRLDYVDRHGQPTAREVEPVLFLSGADGWYLTGWCRLRDELRTFRLNRIVSVQATGRKAPERTIDIQPRGFVTKVASLA